MHLDACWNQPILLRSRLSSRFESGDHVRDRETGTEDHRAGGDLEDFTLIALSLSLQSNCSFTFTFFNCDQTSISLQTAYS